MAKKSKDDVPNPNSVMNRDILQRLNFLYQASQLLGTQIIPPPLAQESVPNRLKGKGRKREMRRRFKERHSTACEDLSRTYVKSMKAIGQKTNMRMDPAVKRTLCKGCDLVLVPGMTAQVRVNTFSNTGHTLSYTCLSCQKARRIPAPPTIDEVADAVPVHKHNAPAMAVDVQGPPVLTAASASKASNRRKPKQGPTPQLPPLFERNVGHVVFRGNERIA